MLKRGVANKLDITWLERKSVGGRGLNYDSYSVGAIAKLRKMLLARIVPSNGRCLRASGKV